MEKSGHHKESEDDKTQKPDMVNQVTLHEYVY
jgi:hypothetical protein